jgi:hypothetical protein
MKHVVMFSGGLGSWGAAKRVAAAHGTADLVLLFTDTRAEDEDLYRFLGEAAADAGGEFVTIAEGRTPWEVFNDVKYLGNTRVDPCSRVLKREPAAAWLKAHCDPASTVVYVGIDWTEEHRFAGAQRRYAELGWTLQAPLCEPPLITKHQLKEELAAAGIALPRLYTMGFPHNNCGGFCVKAGQAHFKLLLEKLPERYAEHEAQEQALRERLGKDVAIMRDRTGGQVRPLTMRQLRLRVEGAEPIDKHEWGGCGCFMDDQEAA